MTTILVRRLSRYFFDSAGSVLQVEILSDVLCFLFFFLDSVKTVIPSNNYLREIFGSLPWHFSSLLVICPVLPKIISSSFDPDDCPTYYSMTATARGSSTTIQAVTGSDSMKTRPFFHSSFVTSKARYWSDLAWYEACLPAKQYVRHRSTAPAPAAAAEDISLSDRVQDEATATLTSVHVLCSVKEDKPN